MTPSITLTENAATRIREILAKEERAEEDKARAQRVKAQGLRDYGEQMLATSLGCQVRELIADPNTFHVDERLGMLIVQFPLIIPGVFLNCTLSSAKKKTDTGALVEIRTVVLHGAGFDEEAVSLPASREIVIKLLGDAVEAQ